jgi:hypothetical protein
MKYRLALQATAIVLCAFSVSGCVRGDIDDDPGEVVGTNDSAVISAGPFGCSGTQVALRTIRGYYVVAEGGGGREVRADRAQIGAWERFTVHDLGGGKVALQASSGHFVVAEGGGGREVKADRPWIGDWEKWSLARHWNGYHWTLRAHNGNYMVAEEGGGGVVNANRPWVGEWEAFTAVCL